MSLDRPFSVDATIERYKEILKKHDKKIEDALIEINDTLGNFTNFKFGSGQMPSTLTIGSFGGGVKKIEYDSWHTSEGLMFSGSSNFQPLRF